jgi:7-cyano-7-deazaguanine synthase in queuosine biosynthesis
MSQDQNNHNRPVVDLLWTGGWDSTFRLLQLSTKDVTVQPHYLADARRKSQSFELNTIRSITDDIRNLATTRCAIRDLIIVNVSDILQDVEITHAYKKVAENHKLGIQYEWLARYSKIVTNLEIGDENGSSPDSILLGAIRANGAIKKITDDKKGVYYIVDQSVSADHIIKVFGNYHYPILFYNKLEMKREAEELGFIELMNKTWFCHTPIDGQPCGTCVACAGTIKKGLGYRLGEAALGRYKREKFIEPVKNTCIYKSTIKLKKLIKSAKVQLLVKKASLGA